MRAKDVMTTPVVTVSPDTPITEIAKRLINRRISAAPVVDGQGRLVGIVSEGDLMWRPETGGERHSSWWLALLEQPEAHAREYVKTYGKHARDVMTRDVVTVTEDASLEEIATLLEKHRIKRVPVLRDGELVGIMSRANLLQGIVARQRAPDPAVDDCEPRKRVTEAIRDIGVRSEFVNVVVSDGVVELWGLVYSDAELHSILLAAANVAGVKEVVDYLSVIPPSAQGLIGVE